VEKHTEEDTFLKQIRTFQGDVASAIETQNETLVSIQRAQEQKNAEAIASGIILSPEEKAEREARKKTILLLIGTVLLFVLGSVGTWYAYKTYKLKTTLPTQQIFPNRFLITESSEKLNVLNLNKDSFIQKIQNEWILQGGSGVKQIQLERGSGTSTELIKTSEFLSLLRSHAPGSLIRAFDPLFMFGIIGGIPKHTFILIKLDSFELAYAGMLNWEKDISDDILPLFAPYGVVQTVPSQTSFGDLTLRNKDVRVLKDPTGKTVLLYTFYDNNMLIITDNEEALKNILTRLDSEKLSR
ncbi:MAG: hypothetical protein WAZ50_00070, partial [Minisyncoccia bacterium]